MFHSFTFCLNKFHFIIVSQRGKYPQIRTSAALRSFHCQNSHGITSGFTVRLQTHTMVCKIKEGAFS